jgi:L-aspartate oxidase
VHGANRLASNSLLEGMVFGFRVVEAVEAGRDGPEASGAMRAVLGAEPSPWVIGGGPVPGWSPYPWPDQPGDPVPLDAAKLRDRIQRAMTVGAGVLRSAASLDETGRAVEAAAAEVAAAPREPATEELRNLVEVGRALVAAGSHRAESRGAHTRSDHPDRADGRFRHRLVLGGPPPP